MEELRGITFKHFSDLTEKEGQEGKREENENKNDEEVDKKTGRLRGCTAKSL